MAINNDKNIDIIIAGHTHRPVYENLSLTERRSIKTGKKLKPDPVYYNTGSCVHPRCITGIEITVRDDRPYFTLIKWSHDVKKSKQAEAPDEYNLSIKRTVLEP